MAQLALATVPARQVLAPQRVVKQVPRRELLFWHPPVNRSVVSSRAAGRNHLREDLLFLFGQSLLLGHFLDIGQAFLHRCYDAV